jgi:hypothetical protein
MSAQLITLVATDENGRTGFAHYMPLAAPVNIFREP